MRHIYGIWSHASHNEICHGWANREIKRRFGLAKCSIECSNNTTKDYCSFILNTLSELTILNHTSHCESPCINVEFEL